MTRQKKIALEKQIEAYICYVIQMKMEKKNVLIIGKVMIYFS